MLLNFRSSFRDIRQMVAELFQLVDVVDARHALRTQPREVEHADIPFFRIGRIGHRDRPAVIVNGGKVGDAVLLRGKPARIILQLGTSSRIVGIFSARRTTGKREQAAEGERGGAEKTGKF